LDDFNNHLFVESLSNSNVREVYTVSNKHKYKNWNKVFHISCQNLHVYESFGIHPKFLPEHNLNATLIQLENIVRNKNNPVSGRPIVGIGEVGLDETSRFQMIDQKIALERQIIIASQKDLPLILHCRGSSLYRPLFDSISSILPKTHPIQWHCIKSDSDLVVIDDFISSFPNSVISLNGAATLIKDIDQDKTFKKWIRNHPHILNHLVLETDCPWLCPQGLSTKEYNPCTGIFVTSKWVENVIRAAGKNASTIIQIANNNANKIFRFSTNKY
jgi:Tat protein secretion system quality control protein TatD with DNase activity